MTRRALLKSASGWTLGLAAAGAAGAADPADVPQSDRRRIEDAIPKKAFVPPRKPRRLLIFDLNVGYGGHKSIPTANAAFASMGEKTGAFETVVSRDPSVFAPDSLGRFDAVFLNNTVGNLFEDAALRRSLVEFVYGGGGLMGVHGTSVAFTRWPEGAIEDWPEFARMIGARGANHRENTEHVQVKLDDPDHPLNRAFGGKAFDYRDEFFRVHGPYSRDRLRVLFSIDTEKTDMNQGQAYGNVVRKDNDYALAWVRNYGRGRVFYCTIAHHPSVFRDPMMLRFYLAATQFALGDLPAPTTPSGRLTPAVRAREKLGWRLGFEAPAAEGTLFEAIDKTAGLHLLYMGCSTSQKVSDEIPKSFDDRLTAEDMERIRLKLDSAGVRLLTLSVREMPRDETALGSLFEVVRKMGVETIITGRPPQAIDRIEKLCDENDIRLATRNASPREVMKLCRDRSERIGACADLAAWQRSGIAPIEAARTLEDRLIAVHIPAPSTDTAVPLEPFLSEIHRLGIQPTMFALTHFPNDPDPAKAIAQTTDRLNGIAIQLGR